MYGQQMTMFQEGGVSLQDEGGEVEETSGNKVPLGGVKEGVADDQPAQLSSGEMVLSEDVVRYHGVEKIMALRDEAKIGYKKMEAMGQLGNSDEATIPTEAIFNPGGMPFSVVDLEYIEMDENDNEAEVMAMADKEDEPIEAQTGTLVPVQQPAASFSRINPTTGLPEITTAPAASVPQVLQPGTTAPITTGSALTPTTLSTLTPTSTPISAPDRPATQQPAPLTQLPSAQQFLGGVSSTNFFINEIGQVIQIPVINGKQLFEEPEGFQPHDPTNPVPFDPDLEEDTVTTPDEQPQRRRTVTDREEGGQPDTVGDIPDTSFADSLDAAAKGINNALGLPATNPAEIEARNAAIQHAVAMEALGLNMTATELATALEQRNIGALGFGTIGQIAAALGFDMNTISKEDLDTVKQRAIEAHREARAGAKDDETEAEAFGRSMAAKGATDIEAQYAGYDDTEAGQAAAADAAAAAGDFDSGLGFGGDFDAPDASPDADPPGTGYIAKGGLVSKPKSKKKAKKKKNNNRKGLASKNKY